MPLSVCDFLSTFHTYCHTCIEKPFHRHTRRTLRPVTPTNPYLSHSCIFLNTRRAFCVVLPFHQLTAPEKSPSANKSYRSRSVPQLFKQTTTTTTTTKTQSGNPFSSASFHIRRRGGGTYRDFQASQSVTRLTDAVTLTAATHPYSLFSLLGATRTIKLK